MDPNCACLMSLLLPARPCVISLPNACGQSVVFPLSQSTLLLDEPSCPVSSSIHTHRPENLLLPHLPTDLAARLPSAQMAAGIRACHRPEGSFRARSTIAARGLSCCSGFVILVLWSWSVTHARAKIRDIACNHHPAPIAGQLSEWQSFRFQVLKRFNR